MRNSRRNGIDRSDIDDDKSIPPTLAEVDAALYGKLARVDGTRRAVERTRFGAFKLTATGLEIGDAPQQKDWEEIGQFLFQVELGIQWLIGDWLMYGEQVKWGEIEHIATSLGRDRNTLYGYVSVCRAINMLRRRNILSFGHHREVMSLPVDEQEAALNYAEQQGVSVADFRKWLRQSDTRSVKRLTDYQATPEEQRSQVYEQYRNEIERFLHDRKTLASLSPLERREVIHRAKWIQDSYADLIKSAKEKDNA